MSRVIALSMALAFAGLAIRSELIAAVSVALLAAALLSRGWLRSVERGLLVWRELPEHLPWGESAQVVVTVRNRALLRVPWLEIRESVPLALRVADPPRRVLTLGAGESGSIGYTIRGARRGLYVVGPLQISLGDVLGLQRVRLNGPVSSVVVYPRVLPLPELGLPAALLVGPLRGKRGEDPARPAGVRPYLPGDDIRRLDWKASAHGRALLVRRADATIAPEVTIALAFGRRDYAADVVQDAQERAVIVAASLAAHLLHVKLPVSLLTNGYDPATQQMGAAVGWGKGEGHRHLLLNLLGRLATGDDTPLFAVLAAHPLPWGGTIMLIIGDLSPACLPDIAALRRRGQGIVLLLVEATRDGLALARQEHLSAFRVGRRGDPIVVREP